MPRSANRSSAFRGIPSSVIKRTPPAWPVAKRVAWARHYLIGAAGQEYPGSTFSDPNHLVAAHNAGRHDARKNANIANVAKSYVAQVEAARVQRNRSPVTARHYAPPDIFYAGYDYQRHDGTKRW